MHIRFGSAHRTAKDIQATICIEPLARTVPQDGSSGPTRFDIEENDAGNHGPEFLYACGVDPNTPRMYCSVFLPTEIDGGSCMTSRTIIVCTTMKTFT